MHSTSPTRTELIRSVQEARGELVALARSLSPAELEVQVHPGWTVKDVLAHVAASEARLVDRAVKIANGQATTDPSYNPQKSTQVEVEKRRGQSVDDFLGELTSSRADLVRTLDTLKDDQLSLQGCLASGTPIDVIGIFRRIADHERGHCAEIRAAIGP